VAVEYYEKRYFTMLNHSPISAFIFGGGMCDENSCNVFMLLFIVLWVLIPVMLCRRAVLMLWHAFRFLGLRPVDVFSLFSFFCSVVVSSAFSYKKYL
jgi:hypothetical protein